MMMKRLTVLTLAATFALNGCVTDPVTGQQTISKTALFGLGGGSGTQRRPNQADHAQRRNLRHQQRQPEPRRG